MIFVTVGTHEQQFNRLIQKVDELKRDGIIKDDVFMQTGFSTYEPKYCDWTKLISYNDILEKVRNARIVITHGGPASFIMSLQENKIPIVVPRQLDFNEHINNHQVEFTKFVVERQHNLIPVYDIEKLEIAIKDYDVYISQLNNQITSNNRCFNQKLDDLLNHLYDK